MVPTIVWALPFHREHGFELVTLASVIGTALLFYALVRELSNERRAWFAVVAYLVGVSPVMAFSAPYLVDAFTMMAILGALYCAVTGRWWMAAVVVIVGCIAKETVVGAVLPMLVLAWRAKDRRAIEATAAAFSGGLAIYFLIRYTPLVFGDTPPRFNFLSLETLRSQWADAQAEDGSLPKTAAMAFTGSLGPLWVAVPIALREARGRLAALGTYLIPVGAGLVIANAWTRLALYALIVALPLVACTPWLRLRHMAVLVVAVAAQSWLVDYLPQSGARYGMQGLAYTGLLVWLYVESRQSAVRRAVSWPDLGPGRGQGVGSTDGDDSEP